MCRPRTRTPEQVREYHRQYYRRYYQNNKEQIYERQKKWRASRPNYAIEYERKEAMYRRLKLDVPKLSPSELKDLIHRALDILTKDQNSKNSL